MKIIHHIFGKNKKIKESSAEGFLISNHKGDYLWSTGSPKSRYEGWFCRISKSKQMYRIIESIIPKSNDDDNEYNPINIYSIKNNFNYIERKNGDLREYFYISPTAHAMMYEVNKEREIDVFFDMRKSYDNSRGLSYEIKVEKGLLIIEFENKIFLAIEWAKAKEDKESIIRHYSYDENRNSFPVTREVTRGLSLFGKKFIFAVGETKQEAIKNTRAIFSKNIALSETREDVLCARNSLHNLVVHDDNFVGIYAGLPWFFQFWPRDEAVSLKSLLFINPQQGKIVFQRLLKNAFIQGPGGVINADALGWIFKRASDVWPFLSLEEKKKIQKELKTILEKFESHFMNNGIIINDAHQTWMDSIPREGARIEMQAMVLNMYRFMASISKTNKKKNIYQQKERKMRLAVRNIFWDKENIYDGYYPQSNTLDKSIRCNVFIAAYIYPHLLSKKEWNKCFTNALNHLWLSWGGVASLSKYDSRFHAMYSGEDSKSYHQGDSWYYINNLTAIVLYRTNKKKFNSYIKKIMKASKEDIMWKGAVGCHSEISSATEQRSEGCINQAWSSAMYLEAIEEIAPKE